MADPRLNSVHLDVLRRQEFRDARQALLAARGEDTRYMEGAQLAAFQSAPLRGQIQDRPPPLPVDAGFVLMDRQAVYPLKVGLNTVGRMPDNDVVVDDPYISRRHCAILVHTGQKCELHDIASKNGTFLNGRKLAGPASLVPGDEVRMCERQFIFLSGSDLNRPPEATASKPEEQAGGPG